MGETSIFDYITYTLWAIIFLKLIFACMHIFVKVPQGYAYIVERWGRYNRTLNAGFQLLPPFADKIAFKQDLREQTIPVPPQECFTSDNVKVLVDGVMYISVVNPHSASYGVTDYRFAAIQMAQTATRSVIGTIELDRTFKERDLISTAVVKDVNEAGRTWGIVIHRYEIKSISTPNTVRSAMEQQVTAEREGRALVARAEGDKQSRINRSEGRKEELINKSQGEMQAMINEAEGKAEEILQIAEATAQSIEQIADAITAPGGLESHRMQIMERYLKALSSVSRSGTQVVLPANLMDFGSLTKQLSLSDISVSEAECTEAAALKESRLRAEMEKHNAEIAAAEAAAKAEAKRAAEKAQARLAAAGATSPVTPISSNSHPDGHGADDFALRDEPVHPPFSGENAGHRPPPPPMRRRAPVV